MRDYLAALKHGFSGLVRFSGRDGSVLFWSYAATIIFLGMVLLMAGLIPTMAEAMVRMQEFAIQNPEQATIQKGPGSYSVKIEGSHPELMPDMTGLFAFVSLISVAVIGLLAASVTRRLHDTGLRGYWGLIPIPFLISWTMTGPQTFENFDSGAVPEIGNVLLIMLNNMLFMGSLGLLMFLLLRKPVEEQANRSSETTRDDKLPRQAHRRP